MSFGPVSRWKDHSTAAIADLLESSNQFKDVEKEVLWTMLADKDVNAAFDHPKVFTEFYSLAGKKNKDEDSPDFVEAMTGPYEEQFRDAMKEEIEGLVKRRTWDLVSKDSIGKENPQEELLPITWAFKIK